MKKMKMKLGDLVENLNSEGGLLGVVVGWQRWGKAPFSKAPVVSWADGRVSWVMPHLVNVVQDAQVD